MEKIEVVCHYSYRNINRIFEAIHNETIGKYIKRLRLQKATHYLRYSEMTVTDIGFTVGFDERAAFSKAFKSKYGCSPATFRKQYQDYRGTTEQYLQHPKAQTWPKLEFETVYLPEFHYLFLEFLGDYEDFSAIGQSCHELYQYVEGKSLICEADPRYMAEIIDDSEISPKIHLRCNLALILDAPLTFQPQGLFQTKVHPKTKYARFVYTGSYLQIKEFYNLIYANWLFNIDLELRDLPTLELYPDDTTTEVYIPVR